MARNYIIYTWPFSPDNGGVIFMHQLVHALNGLGERAFLWQAGPVYDPGLRGRIRRFLHPKPMLTAPGLNTPIARKSDLTRDSIVVYPEIVRGNPLRAAHVARWLLYRPGLLHPYEFGPNEMFFKAGEMCDLPEVTGGAPDLYLWRIDPSYRNENRPDRKGTCHILRKGAAKPRIPETEDGRSICIDGMSHAEINEVFNRCDTFYSYDEVTFYSQYAAICGCTSIVIPGLYASRQDWVAAHPIGRAGVAYGLGDTAHAKATRAQVLGMLKEKEAQGLETVRAFVSRTRAGFGL